MEDGSQWSLAGGTNILMTELHDCIMKIAHVSPEINLFDIEKVHFDLIIAIDSIHKGEY